MAGIEDLAKEFLDQERLAVVGVSRSGKGAARGIFDKLKSTGHTVFAVNPRANEIDGEPCYPDLLSISGGVDGVVAVTRPEITDQVVLQCIDAGIPRVWMHRAMGNSVSEAAVEMCRDHNMQVIPGGCPMMYQEPVDMGHKCIKWWFRFTGRLPK